MVNNFGIISDYLTFDDNDTYYHLQIIRRGKDNQDMSAANRTIKSYYITDKQMLDKYMDEIICLCKTFNARAYINLAPKSARKTALLQLKYISERIFNNDTNQIWKSFQTCAGKIRSKKPAWIIDIDNVDSCDYKADDVIETIKTIEPLGDKIKIIIPTKSGLHIITSPFRLDKFKELFPDIEIHKNNPTNLYIP